MYKKLNFNLECKDYSEKTFKCFEKINEYFDFGETVIDLGCGHGKFSIICRDLGYKVTGIDARRTRVPFHERGIDWIISDVSTLDTIEADTVLYFGLLYHLNYEQQVDILSKIKSNTLVINTHFAIIDNNGDIKNETNIKSLSIDETLKYNGVIYKESDSFESLASRPLASFSNLTSFWPTIDSLCDMLKDIGGYKEIFVVEPYLMRDRTYIIARK